MTATDIADWLKSIGLEQYERNFTDNAVDIDLLPSLTNDDLKDIGISLLGHRKRLLHAVAGLDIPAAPGRAMEPEAGKNAAERRQVTVVFCDLVGSTALSRQLDPEDMRELLRRYQDAVAGAVSRFGGHIAKYLGDGVLAYFGWPIAHEDQAERAVRAGIASIDAVGRIDTHSTATLRARVGIATGEVVVGDLTGTQTQDADAIVGATPNLAARLQSLARPDQLVVDPVTRDLIGRIFDLIDLGPNDLKGFDQPVVAWQVAGERRQESRFDALRGSSAIVGRDHEIGLLIDRWQAAVQGEGQAVLISGEPGIGKSRIVTALRDRLDVQPAPFRWLTFQSMPFHGATPLHPFVAWMTAAAELEPDDIEHGRIEKLTSILTTGTENTEAIALIGDAIGFAPEYLKALDLEPSRRRVRIMEVIVEQIAALTRQSALVVVLEDAHWADPTTLETLEILIDRISDQPILVLVTHRPEFSAVWQFYPHVSLLTLGRLPRNHVERLVAELTGSHRLPEALMAAIVERTDGVPLFVEEITAALLEMGSDEDAAALDAGTVPVTLQALLHARLDRLSDAKPVAQIAAVIGRTFDEALLTEVMAQDEADLPASLDRLVASGLVLRRNRGSGRYMFKHALIQDAAYSSLLRPRRRDLHRRLGVVLERRAIRDKAIEPALLAHHFQQADDSERAKQYWRQGLDRAMHRTAEHEALDCATNLAALLRNDVGNEAALREELDLQLLCGRLLYEVSGMGTPAARVPLERAQTLAEQVEDIHSAVMARVPLSLSLMSPSYTILDAIALQEDSLDLATRHQFRDLVGYCQGMLAWSVYIHGDYGRSLELFDQSLRHQTEADIDDRKVMSSKAAGEHYRGLHLTMLGFPDQGLEAHLRAVPETPKIVQPHIRTSSYVVAAAFRSYRREPMECLELAYSAIRESEEHRYAYMRPHAELYEAWALTLLGRGAEKRSFLEASIAAHEKNKTRLFLELFAYVLADGLLQNGDIDGARSALRTGFDCIAVTGADCWRPELHRLNAEALAADGAVEDDVEQEFANSIAAAQRQQSKLLELRAACGVAQLRMRRDANGAARQILQPVYDWFTEGFDTPDLKDAKAVLDALS